jgi:hypothetical protein
MVNLQQHKQIVLSIEPKLDHVSFVSLSITQKNMNYYLNQEKFLTLNLKKLNQLIIN